MAALMVPSAVGVIELPLLHKLYAWPSTCSTDRSCAVITSLRVTTKCMKNEPQTGKSNRTRRPSSFIAFALNIGNSSSDGNQENLADGESSGLDATRLGRIVGAGSKQLLAKLNAARKNFPMKIFLLLLGFYTANALATILGQTGDWDVLVAGIVVAAIEGIGMLMYRKSMSPLANNGKLQSLVVMVNFWKAGVCLGLFVDAFKLGS